MDGGFGRALVHYQFENKMLMDMADADGNLLFRDMYKNRHGSVSYNWQDKKNSSVREMIASYTAFEPWDIMVVANGYADADA